MTGRWRRRLQIAAACVSIAAYAACAHYCNLAGEDCGWGAAIALTPLLLLLVIFIWRKANPVVSCILLAMLAAVVIGAWPWLEPRSSLLFLLEESVLYSLLAMTFGRSLMPANVAFCTRIADRVHGPLSPREVWYTRMVTAAWSLIFGAVTVISILLFAFAPLRIWSVYINFCVFPFVILAFLTEALLVRRRALPRTKQSGLLETVRLYFAATH